MSYFPLYVDISNKNCVVIGGGNTAARKIKKLLLFNAKITVIAPYICEEIKEIKNIKILNKKFKDKDVDNAFIVIGATDDKKINSRISQICREKNIPVNIVDEPQNCSFYFPSIVRKNNITIGISTDGEAPLIARFLREKIEKFLDDDIIKISEKISECRKKIRVIFNDEDSRKTILEELLKRCLNGEMPENIDDFIREMRDKFENTNRNTEQSACACTDSNGL